MRTALVTGASSGIGAASVQRFIAEGWAVAATMRSPQAASLEPSERLRILELDVSDIASISSAVASTIEEFGRLDAVVNNAGYGQYGVFEAISDAEIRQQFEVNVFGPMNVIRAALPHLRAAERGVVVNVGSGGGLYGLPMTSVYCASKFALDGFSESLSYELRGTGVSMKLVVPHGGVAGTAFGASAAMPPIPSEYEDYAAESWHRSAAAGAPIPVDAPEVASVVYAAATDPTDRLRYLVGNDTRGLIEALDLPLPEREQRMRELLH